MVRKLDFTVINKGNFQRRAFVMLHGWKGNKESFNSIPNILDIPDTMWFTPEAPYMVDGDPNKKTWTYEKSPGEWEVKEPRAMLMDFMKREVLSKFKSRDTYIMGFSQGAAVCYAMVLSFDLGFGGIFPIGGFLRAYPRQKDNDIIINVSSSQKDTPILIGHGKDDDVVSADASRLAYKLLKKQCNNVELHIYNGRHKIGMEYLKKVKSLVLNQEKLEGINT